MGHKSLFSAVRDRIPAEWADNWIDYLHSYLLPSLEPEYMEIYGQYAETVEEAEPKVGPIWRIPI